ncbi:MAG: LysR family transcriptional regulator, partial [Myxococcota bacterium]
MSPMIGFHNPMNSIHDLSRVDLNLLVAFDALAREQSVTQAAAALGVTQSAMSHTLRRLRAVFDDPLLIRSGRGMRLTPRAEGLIVPLRAGLTSLGRVLSSPSTFDPATANRAFCIAGPDLFSALVLPNLLTHLRLNAPGVDLQILPTGRPSLGDDLETGQVDLCVQAVPEVGPAVPALPAVGMVRRTLFHDGFSCFVRREHPITSEGPLSVQRYAALPHILVSPSGQGAGPVDLVLAKHGLQRRIALRVPHFSTALTALRHSDLVLTASSALTELVGEEITVVEPPAKTPRHGIALVWHERWSADAGHR